MVVEKMHLLAHALREGKVDLFHDSVVPTMVLSKWAGLSHFKAVEIWRRPNYVGLIVVKKNSGIDSAR